MSDTDWLAEPLATIAFCWRVERCDGVAIGLTAHDRDLTIDGLVHHADPGMTPSLGDARCRVAMAGRRRIARVVAGDAAVLTVDIDGAMAGAYADGRLRWLGGANAGLEEAIVASADASVTLRRPPRYPVAPGDMVELTEGCDKTIATCTGRFANAANFRGEPYLPGIDLLTRYPGA